MSIIGVHIENFTSYKSLSLDNLSPNCNMVLGCNGHGKSNFLNGKTYKLALQFVLTEKYQYSSIEDFQKLQYVLILS